MTVDSKLMTALFVSFFMLILCCQILESSPAVGVVGGVVNMNMTIDENKNETLYQVRYLYDPNNTILLVFSHGSVNAADYINPYFNVSYTGNISKGFVSFTLVNLTIQSAGIYQYKISLPTNGSRIAGEQNLIIAGRPSTPVITALSQQAVAGNEYKLNCSAVSTSVKPGHNLTMFSEWKRNGINIMPDDSKYGVNGTILTIRNLNKTDNNDSLTCIAFEDQRVRSRESTAFPLNVYYGPDIITLYPSEMSYDLVENSSLNVKCSADCVPSCQYRWTGPGRNYTDTSGILSISNISRGQTGNYTCTAFNPNITSNAATATVLLTVQYGPDNITLSPSQTSFNTVENSSLNVNCSADCIPICQYRWTGPGVNYFDKTGMLSISKISRNQTGVFTCTATNPNLTSNSATATMSVTVQYGPDNIKLSPSQKFYLLENSSLKVNCSADCVPECHFRWTGPGVNYTDKTGMLSISKMKKNQTGDYTCTAFIPNITSNSATATVLVTVQYGPDSIKLSASQMPYEVVENSSLNVNCSADCVPSCQYSWTGPGVNYTDTTGILSISKINRNQTGDFTCTASNPSITSNSATATVLVTVQYPPSIQGLTSSYKVIENQTLNVTCEVNSNPPANLIFWSPKGEGSVNSILYFSSVSRNKSGIYNCTAQNTMKPTDGQQQNRTTTNQIQVDVQYGARISNLSVQGGNTINENSSAIFNCHVDSNPPSNITWIKEGSSAVLKTESGVTQSNYTIKSAECLENYSCTADNGIWTTAKVKLELFVRCHPRTDFRLDLEPKLYRRRHEEAILRYTVISYPPPTFAWVFLGNDSESRVLPASASQHDNGQQSELRITSLDNTDFGNYSVIANNSLLPSAMEVFEIIQADFPDVPSDVTIIEITQTSVKVQWMAGYNGGPQQTFHIVASAGSSTYNVTANDPGYRQTGTAVLNGLLPGTKYSIYVMSTNSVGPSNNTEAIHVTTLEDTDSTHNFPLAAVAGGIGAGVGVILVVALVVFLVRRYQHQKPYTDGIMDDKTERNRPESGLVDNPVYDTSGPLPGPSATAGITEAEYAKVNKPKKKSSNMDEASNIYAQVNKTKKNFKKDADKGKLGKMSRGDIYENAADLVLNTKAESCNETLYEDAIVPGSNDPLKNKDGLHYADLMLGPPSKKDGKDIIRGIENRTEYAEIAYGKRGEPLPDSDN